jgi:hypothetical protein
MAPRYFEDSVCRMAVEKKKKKLKMRLVRFLQQTPLEHQII